MRERPQTTAMRNLADAIAGRALADAQVIRAVRQARDVGVTWAAIAQAFGLRSRQAAFERFGNKIGERE